MTNTFRRRCFRLLTLASLSLVFGLTVLSQRTACAQAMVAGEENKETDRPVQPPFLLPAQPTEITEAMEDFRRFAGRKQWEKAFKHLEKVFGSTADGLVLTADGIMLPSRLIAREALLELSPAGQDAYRLFFDAEAKKLLDQAEGKEELAKLSQIFARFLITASGDAAADKLGDLHFEAGNLDQAVHAWQSILEQRPDSRLSRARLRLKIGIALARLKRWGEFHELLKLYEEQHATEKVTLAGKEVVAIDHLRSLADRSKGEVATPSASPSQGAQPDIPLAAEVDPLWQFRFFPDVDPKVHNQRQGLQLQNRWNGGQNSADFVPPAVVDDKRVYVNFVGYDMGIDIESGKLLWRSGRLFDAQQKAQQGQITPLEQHGLAIGMGRLWSVARESGGQNQNQNRMGMGGDGARFGIISRELDTGKKAFSSQQSTELKDWSMRGAPLIDGDRVYVAANKTMQQRELDLLALNAKDGKLLWSSKIGSYTSESNPWMIERTFQPALMLNNGKLYIETHSGSLVQFDADSGQIQWGVNYVSDVPQGHRFWGWGMMDEAFTAGVPKIVDGVLYLKGMRSQKLYAVDPQRPRVSWHRPIERIANLIGVDETRFYLGGEDVSAYDLKNRKIIWSVKIPKGTSWANAILTQNHIYHFSARGIYEIKKSNGRVNRVFRGADLDSLGGNLIVTPKALITVSNLAVTGYPLSVDPNNAKSDANSASTAPAKGEPVASAPVQP